MKDQKKSKGQNIAVKESNITIDASLDKYEGSEFVPEKFYKAQKKFSKQTVRQ